MVVNLRLTACPGDGHSAAGKSHNNSGKNGDFFMYRLVFYISYSPKRRAAYTGRGKAGDSLLFDVVRSGRNKNL